MIAPTSPPGPVDDPRPLWAQAFEDAVSRLDRLAGDLSPQQADWRSAPGRWSVAECIEHLNVTAELYLPGMETAAREAKGSGRWPGGPPYARGPLGGRFLISFLDPTRATPKRARAPAVFRPSSSDLELPALATRFRAANRRFLALLAQSDGLALGNIRLATPVSRLLRVSLAQAFEIHAVHQHRHLAQAEDVRATEGFPAG